MEDYNEEYIIELTEKIEKLTGLKDWVKIAFDNDMDFHRAEEIFDDVLDDCYPDVELLGHNYNLSRVLKDTDPIVYNIALNEHFDNEISEGILSHQGHLIFYREDLEKLLKKLETKKGG